MAWAVVIMTTYLDSPTSGYLQDRQSVRFNPSSILEHLPENRFLPDCRWWLDRRIASWWNALLRRGFLTSGCGRQSNLVGTCIDELGR
jgi:hypothetical protein